MTRPNLQRRSALHAKRGFHMGRAPPIVLDPPVVETTPTPATPAHPNPKDKNTPDTPATSSTTDLIAGILSSILSPESTTSKSSSSTTSTTSSVSTTTSKATTSSSHTTTTPTATSTTPHVVVQTATRVSSSTSIQSQTPSQTAQTSNGISAVTVISGIGGALLATILLTVTIGFFLRRWRRKRSAEMGFEASQFRRSGVLLDEKDDITPDRPRPPSMIERRNAASPPAAYPYSDEPSLSANEHGQSFAQYGTNQAQYGAVPIHPSYAVGSQFGGNGGAPAMLNGANPYTRDYGQGDLYSTAYAGPGEQPGFGAPPVPGIHGPGAYAPYGVDPRYPQSQRYPRSNQYQNQQPQLPQLPQQHGFGQGLAVDTSTSSTRDENVPNLANPFSPLRVTKKLGPTENPGPESRSTPTPPSSTPPPSSNPGTTPFVTRQSHETLPTYTNNGGYADVQRDVKMSPALLNVVNGGSDTDLPRTNAATTTTTMTKTESNGGVTEPPRPLTVYGDDDVYGGM